MIESLVLPVRIGETSLSHLSAVLRHLSRTDNVSTEQILDSYCLWLYHAVGRLDRADERAHAAQISAWCASLCAQNFAPDAILDSFEHFSARQAASDPCSLRSIQLTMKEINRITSTSVENTRPVASATDRWLPVRQPSGSGFNTPMGKLAIGGHESPDPDITSQRQKGDKQKNGSPSSNMIPNGSYVCKRCGVPGHFLQKCPTNLDPSFDKTPSGYRCGICRAVGQHITSLCPSNTDRSSLYQQRLRAQYGDTKTDSRGPTRGRSRSNLRDRGIPRIRPAREEWDESGDEDTHRHRSKSRYRDDDRRQYRSKSRHRDEERRQYRSKSRYRDEDRRQHRSKSRYRDKDRRKSSSKWPGAVQRTRRGEHPVAYDRGDQTPRGHKTRIDWEDNLHARSRSPNRASRPPSRGRGERSPIAYVGRFDRSRSPKRLRLEDWNRSSSTQRGYSHGNRRDSPRSTIRSSDQGRGRSRAGNSATVQSIDRMDVDGESPQGSNGWSSRGQTQSPWTQPFGEDPYSPSLRPGQESSASKAATADGEEAVRLAFAKADRFLRALGEELAAQPVRPPYEAAQVAADDVEGGSEHDSREYEAPAPAPAPKVVGDIDSISRYSPVVQEVMRNRANPRVCLVKRMTALDLWNKKQDHEEVNGTGHG